MSTFSTVLLVALVLLLGLAGYYYLAEIAPLKTSVQELQHKNQELEFYVEQLEKKNANLSMQLEEKIKEISTAKEQEIVKLKTTYEDLLTEMKEQVEKGEITITQLADQLKVNIVDRIIFPSGEAELTPEGIKVIERVGNILKETTDKVVKVEGHTDNVPIHPNLQKLFPTNWELSAARATNVVRFLHEKVGIDAKQLEAAGMGEHHPIATNETPKGRAQNRRIEILLIPQASNSPVATKQ
ncbi:MAG TPA: OmpA family protein [bacterium]